MSSLDKENSIPARLARCLALSNITLTASSFQVLDLLLRSRIAAEHFLHTSRVPRSVLNLLMYENAPPGRGCLHSIQIFASDELDSMFDASRNAP